MKRVVGIAPLDGVEDISQFEDVGKIARVVCFLNPVIGVALFGETLGDRVGGIRRGGGGGDIRTTISQRVSAIWPIDLGVDIFCTSYGAVVIVGVSSSRRGILVGKIHRW